MDSTRQAWGNAAAPAVPDNSKAALLCILTAWQCCPPAGRGSPALREWMALEGSGERRPACQVPPKRATDRHAPLAPLQAAGAREGRCGGRTGRRRRAQGRGHGRCWGAHPVGGPERHAVLTHCR